MFLERFPFPCFLFFVFCGTMVIEVPEASAIPEVQAFLSMKAIIASQRMLL